VTTTNVVCRDTDREAEDYYEHYVVEHTDSEALDYHMNMARRNRQVDTAQIFNERKHYAAELGLHPLIGSPQTIAAELVRA
jgi:dimethylsulfone monooxygenase